jgi:hypothetical protein
MIYVSLLLFCVVFFELFVSLRIATDAMAIMARSQEAMRVLGSAQLSDDDKEVFVRRASGQIFIATLRFAAKFALIGLALYALFWCTVTVFPNSERPLLKSFVSPVVIISLTVATMAYAWIRKKPSFRGSPTRA